mmetsp:Transcript_25993/g.66915  ORF Transcript_25993/g.66915 Transcript_25993/m.66915 type:complete len:200 (-) Transcript_25993:159-758(-)
MTLASAGQSTLQARGRPMSRSTSEGRLVAGLRRPYPTATQMLHALGRTPPGIDMSERALASERLSGIGWARRNPSPDRPNFQVLARLEMDPWPEPVVPMFADGRMFAGWEVLSTIANPYPKERIVPVHADIERLARTSPPPRRSRSAAGSISGETPLTTARIKKEKDADVGSEEDTPRIRMGTVGEPESEELQNAIQAS